MSVVVIDSDDNAKKKKFQADDKISQEQSNAVTVVIYCWILVKSQKIQSKV